MSPDANAVPLGRYDLDSYQSVLSAQACMLVTKLPADVLVAILPVLEKYAVSAAPAANAAARKPDCRRMTVHLRRQ
jgi:hypothetical protein